MATDRPACRAQLARLIQILLRLQTPGRPPNAGDLAEACEVSRRTIYRDLEALVLAGVPIAYRRDRQGYALAGPLRLPVPPLDRDEAQALVLAVRAAGPSATAAAERALAKCLDGLPEPDRSRVRGLAALVEPTARTDAPTRIDAVLLEALALRRELRLSYRAPATDGDPVTIRFQAFRLVPAAPGWYLVGTTGQGRRVLVLPLDWLSAVELLETSYTIPDRFRLDRYLRPDPPAPAPLPGLGTAPENVPALGG